MKGNFLQMAEYNIDMYLTIKVTDLIIDAESEEQAKNIAKCCDLSTMSDLCANMYIDEVYDIDVEALDDDEIEILSPDEIEDIFDELVAIERDNFEEDQEFDSLADDYEEFSDYMFDRCVYDSEMRQKLWNRFEKELDNIVHEFTAAADEED